MSYNAKVYMEQGGDKLIVNGGDSLSGAFIFTIEGVALS